MEAIEKKIIKTTCPLPMEILKEYFQDKDNTSFLINYRNGKLDANALMIYLSNLNHIKLKNINQRQNLLMMPWVFL